MHPQSLMSKHALAGHPLWLVPMLVRVVLMLLLSATAAHADTIVTADSPDALRVAIQQANGRPRGTHTIIDLEGKPYALQQSPLPSITGSITIRGVNAGLTSISGSCTSGKKPLPVDASFHPEAVYEEWGSVKEFPILSVEAGGFLQLDGVTIRDGQWSVGALNNRGTLQVLRSTVMHNHAHLHGGGIYNTGYLYVQDSTISQNFAHNGYGGGIFNFTNGVVEIRYSTINHNRGNCAGGIYNGTGEQGGGPLSLLNSTISNNKAVQPSDEWCTAGSAGGILKGGISDAWLKSVTITENTTFSSLHGATGGVAAFDVGKFYFDNTIIAKNTPSDCFGVVYTLGGNLVGSTAGLCIRRSPSPWPSNWPPQAADVLDQDPLLDPLRDNGGNTCTHALRTGSPAIDNGWTGAPDSHVFACEAYDQRWAMRASRCDIGAYEYGGRPGQLRLGCTSP